MRLKDFFSYQFSCRKPHINAVFNDKKLDTSFQNYKHVTI